MLHREVEEDPEDDDGLSIQWAYNVFPIRSYRQNTDGGWKELFEKKTDSELWLKVKCCEYV